MQGALIKKYIALAILLAVILVVGCNKADTGNQPTKLKKKHVNSKLRMVVKILKSLHNKIVYVELDRSQYLKNGPRIYNLRYINPETNKPYLLLKTNNAIMTDYLPGRKKMVIRLTEDGNTRTGDIYFSNIDGGNKRKIVRGGGFSIFQNKSRFAFHSDFDEGQQIFFIYSANLSGKNIRRITYRPKGVNNAKRKSNKYTYANLYFGDQSPKISPNGKYLIYTSDWYNQGQIRDIFRVNINGSRKKQLTNGRKIQLSFSNGAELSHDGQKIAAIGLDSNRNGKLFIIDINGKLIGEYALGDIKIGYVWDRHIAWSPNDKQIVLQGLHSISLIDIQTGKINKIFQNSEKGKLVLQSVNWLE